MLKIKAKTVLDAHQHFWELSRGEYDWLTPELSLLYRDFLPQDLLPILKSSGVSQTILVQAAPAVSETYFLLDLAKQHSFVYGVVGWVDMESKQAPDLLSHLKRCAKFLGIRPMIQDIKDDHWMLKRALHPAFDALTQLDLSFDALVFPHHLKTLLKLFERYPDLSVIIDHAAKPQIKNNLFDQWACDIALLANETNIFCKLSGLLTEAEVDCSDEKLFRYMDHLFLCFGPKRMLWGSDWPVINLVSNYKKWFELCFDYVEKNFPMHIDDIFSNNAMRCYARSF